MLDVGTAGVLDITRVQGDPERLVQRPLGGRRVAERPLGRADVRQRVRDYRRIARLAGERGGALAVGNALAGR